MVHIKDGLSFKSLLSVFQHIVVFLLLTHFCGALSELICSHQPIVALVGDDVVLPCHLEPPISAGSERVEWTKPGLDPKYIHVHQYGRLLYQLQNPSYNYRTSLFVDELTNGNVSMKIFSVKISDAGKYFCILPSIHEAVSIQLTVGAVSTPIIGVVSYKSGSVVLQCESAGWYPEPEVFWLDGEGKLVSAGPTETVRGPDDLYTVSSRVTVVKGHGNNFICRVQQQNINQARETHIHVPADVFTISFNWIWISWTFFQIAAILFVLLISCRKITKRIKRKREATTENLINLVRKDEQNIMADSPESSRLTGQMDELENQGATGGGRETADQHEKRKAEQTNKLRKTETENEENVKCENGEDRGSGEDTSACEEDGVVGISEIK
ncbi:butyrophilin subfamily 3 member A2-like isoform X2 [Siniperca chuatsi]|nr:butyrophilin subfamily 3 member A2-like isoform X2 [Siniperca chuatsi]XP_044040045.1 butyrophilin subfamily 3 member A2-like isoform X2 [Siniperca chuatsi]